MRVERVVKKTVKSIILNTLMRLLFIGLACGIISLRIHAVSGHLLQAFYHEGPTKDILMFYADQMPTIEYLSPQNNKQKGSTCIWSFKGLKMAEECKDFALQFNARGLKRGIRLESQPHVRVVVEQKADPCVYTFDSIGGKKGILISVAHNKITPSKEVTAQVPVKRVEPVSKKSSPVIVIDCGHGGENNGARSAQGVYEKEVVLAVGTLVQQHLEKGGFATHMTRSTDVFVPLDTRTSQANSLVVPALAQQGHDQVLFVSIHANNAPSIQASGIETYCSDITLFTPICFKSQGVIDQQLSEDKHTREFLKHDASSFALAQQVHGSVLNTLRRQKYTPIDRKVRRSLSQVLVGAQMPTILIELGFLSHPQEGLLLANKEYQKALAQGIFEGIKEYVQVHKAK